MPASKRMVKRQTVPEDDNGAPAPATRVSKSVSKSAAAPTKAAGVKKAAPRREAPQRDETEAESVRGGWTASQETIDATSPWASNLKVTNQTQIIRFLESMPYASFRRHWIDRVGIGRRAYVCLESVSRPCPLCDVGDRPSAVSAFNVALVGDDGGAVNKSWECGVKVTGVLRTFANDQKVGPLTKPGLYFAVSQSETTQRQQKQTIVTPVRGRDMEEDYGVAPLDDETLERLIRKMYTNEIVQMPRASELEEIAAEMLNEDRSSQAGWSN